MTQKAKLFRFLGYKIDKKRGKITFNYRVEFESRPHVSFSESIILPRKTDNLSKKYIHKFLEPLSLILGISYYKIYFPPKVSVPYGLSQPQAEFWNTVYKKGLGEFLYQNKLDPEKVAKFPYSKNSTEPARIEADGSALLGIGGGKDSIVAMDLLKNMKTVLFSLETTRPDTVSDRIMKISGKPALKIKRILDLKVFENPEGSYNGHIPVSAIYAFMGIFSAALYGHKYVVVGNEYSSNFGNLKYKGETINHQWSKSAEFESMLQEYTRKFITPDITYFSLLRQFHEIRIAEMFREHKKYFHLFSSCNRNFRVFQKRPEHLWCGECPKCAFVFLILAPFLSKAELIKIFGKNLLNNKALLPLYKDILGFGKMKPFDCVGTFEESRVALSLASKKFKSDIVVRTFLSKAKNHAKNMEKVWRTYSAPTLPSPFKLLGIKSVCILGYAREGKVAERYIKENYPGLKVEILDEARDKDYLKKQDRFDLAIKTPGIPRSKVAIPHTTATNLFFAKNKNFTIGVTGSKGKSTTTHLIYDILKRSGKKVRLLGNFGSPMLGALLGKVDPKEIFILELSSYMLDDIQYSPNIAVLLNLFPEHMDYHGGIENYYQAKENIFKFQKPGDIALRFPFSAKIPLKITKIPLLGKHNLENIKAALAVAKVLHVPDKAIKDAISHFKPLPHRLEFVGEYKGVKFYDDAISTTPNSTIMALRALRGVNTIFLGGQDRGYDFRGLEKALRRSRIKNVVLFPDSGRKILRSRRGFKVLETKSMEEAVKFAFRNTKQGGICLLSNASPSYSLWKNFEEKGDLFKVYAMKYGRS